MYRRILVPLDGTPFSEEALVPALGIARRAHALIDLVAVQLPRPVAFPESESLGASGMPGDYLDSVAGRVRATGVSEVSTTVLSGEIASALEKHRADTAADLTVLSTHGRGPLRRAWLGSVADRFLRITAAPVLLVRPQAVGDDDEVDLEGDVTLGKILVAVDGSDLSEAVVEPASELGRLFDVELDLLRLVVFPTFYADGSTTQSDQRLLEALRAAAREELDTLTAQLTARGMKARSSIRVVTHVAEGILESAEDEGADVIALATHGRGGVERMLLGSVADKVIRGADRPVLIVRPRERD